MVTVAAVERHVIGIFDKLGLHQYDWAVPGNLQPEPITLEVWRNLPEEFCRQVELVNGQAIRCEKPSRAHQAAASRLVAMLDAAAEAHMERSPGACLDINGLYRTLNPEEISTVDVPVRIQVDWARPAHLARG